MFLPKTPNDIVAAIQHCQSNRALKFNVHEISIYEKMIENLRPFDEEEEAKILNAQKFIMDNSMPLEGSVGLQNFSKIQNFKGFHPKSSDVLKRDDKSRLPLVTTHKDYKRKIVHTNTDLDSSLKVKTRKGPSAFTNYEWEEFPDATAIKQKTFLQSRQKWIEESSNTLKHLAEIGYLPLMQPPPNDNFSFTKEHEINVDIVPNSVSIVEMDSVENQKEAEPLINNSFHFPMTTGERDNSAENSISTTNPQQVSHNVYEQNVTPHEDYYPNQTSQAVVIINSNQGSAYEQPLREDLMSGGDTAPKEQTQIVYGEASREEQILSNGTKELLEQPLPEQPLPGSTTQKSELLKQQQNVTYEEQSNGSAAMGSINTSKRSIAEPDLSGSNLNSVSQEKMRNTHSQKRSQTSNNNPEVGKEGL